MSKMIVSKEHGLIAVPFVPAVANLMPQAKGLVVDGQAMMAMPHKPAETQLLRAFNINAPSPILHHYDWAGRAPYEVQRHTDGVITLHRRAYVLNGFGTGKTKTALWAIDYLRRVGEVRRALVVAPLSTLTPTWAREVFETVPHLRAVVLHGERKKRIALCESDADIFIINHEGLPIVAEALAARQDIDLVVLDELAKYRNGSAALTKATAKWIKPIPWVWGMTGGPTPNDPTDAHAQIRMLTPANVDPSKMRFREATMIRIAEHKWVPKPDAMETVFRAMQPSVRFTLDDVVELPECIFREVAVTQGPNQEAVYDALVKDAHVQVQAGAITAMNEAALLTKLLQVALGWVYTTNRGVERLDNQARIDVLLDAIEQTQRKVIVFVPYSHALAGVAEEVRKAGHTVEVVEGDTSPTKRNEIFYKFQNTFEPKVLVAHPQTMAHGLTLTEADTIIWFGPTTSLEIFDQANARITRIGQKHKQQVLMLGGTKVERQAYARLRNKQKMQSILLQLFEDDTMGKR